MQQLSKLVGEYTIVYSVSSNSELFKVFMVFHPAVDQIRYNTNVIYSNSNLLAFNIIVNWKCIHRNCCDTAFSIYCTFKNVLKFIFYNNDPKICLIQP